tara:strand:- start:1318 stop:1752 length:435 start_codon:yes stop_codon:yes gene_type:complete
MVYITLLITFLISYSNANNITFEGFGNADISGFSFNDNSSYKLYKSNGHWKSSTGDFGLHECLGTVRTDKNNKNDFDLYCKYISQLNDYFIVMISRDSEYKESGSGKGLIIETSAGYKYLLQAKCSHAVTYLGSDYFAMQKCKF